MDAAGNEVAWGATNRDDTAKVYSLDRMQAAIDAGHIAPTMSPSTFAENYPASETTLSFRCRLPVMEALIGLWREMPGEGNDDAFDHAGAVVGTLYRREGYFELAIPRVSDSVGSFPLVADTRIDGKPWMVETGSVESRTNLVLRLDPRDDLGLASRLSVRVREVAKLANAAIIVHHVGPGLEHAAEWVNDRCNNAPEIRRLRREWNYVTVTERMEESRKSRTDR